MARQLPMVIPEILRGYLAIEEEHPGYMEPALS